MKKFERQRAYYLDGTIKDFKTNRKKTVNTDGLLALVSFYNDGTRVEEEVASESLKTAPRGSLQSAMLSMVQAHLEPKSDGGITPEMIEYRKEHRFNGE